MQSLPSLNFLLKEGALILYAPVHPYTVSDDRLAPDTPKCAAAGTTESFTFPRDANRGGLVFASDDGFEFEANEVSTLPPDMLSGATN